MNNIPAKDIRKLKKTKEKSVKIFFFRNDQWTRER